MILLLIVLGSFLGPLEALNGQKAIYDQIFTNYSKLLRPVKNYNTLINVTLNPAFHNFVEVNEAAETVQYSQWMRHEWQDEFLRWDPGDFDGIESIKIPRTQIWHPDIVIYDMISRTQPLIDHQVFAHVRHTGVVSFSVMEIVLIHCVLKIDMFPFDTQNCTIEVGSWMHDGTEIDLHANMPTDVSSAKDHTEWRLLSITSERVVKTYAISPDPFVKVRYHIAFQRKPQYYIFNLLVPSFVITTLSLIGIFSPFNANGDREEKITMGLTHMMTMSVMLLMATEQMPKTSEGQPVLGIYLMTEMMLSALATFMSVIIMYLHMNSFYKKPASIFIIKILRILTFGRPDHHDDVEKWAVLSHRLDLVCVVFFNTANIVISVVFGWYIFVRK